MQSQTQKWLLGYAILASTIAAVSIVTQAVSATDKTAFKEIDVERINLREADGTLRLVISNTQRLPGIIVKGKEQPHPNRSGASFLFFNEEGTEVGGLTFSGAMRNGVPTSGGHLSFDRYEQDQVIQLTQEEAGEHRTAFLAITDRPDKPMDWAGIAKATALTDRAAKEAAMQKIVEGGSIGAKTRVFLGREPDSGSALALGDAQGRPRMVLRVTDDGAASIQFLDESGKVVRTVTPSGDQK
jgi:hypothetical protein